MERSEGQKPQFITQDAFPEGSLGHTFAPVIAGRERPWTILEQPVYRVFRLVLDRKTIDRLSRSSVGTLESLFSLTPTQIKELNLSTKNEEELKEQVEEFFNKLIISPHQILAETILALDEPSKPLSPYAERKLIDEIDKLLDDSLTDQERTDIMMRFGLRGGVTKPTPETTRDLRMKLYFYKAAKHEVFAFRKLRHPSRSERLKFLIH